MPPLRERSANVVVRPVPYELSKPPVPTDIAHLFDAAARAAANVSVVNASPSTVTPIDDGDMDYKWNCNQIRNKINNLIRSGEIKVTHFQNQLGINSNSYGRFMKLKGPYSGCDNQTYHAAHSFFRKRELAGVKAAKPKKMTAADTERFNVDSIVLDGEEDEDVEVYDTCDDVRSKIQAHLREPGITQAAFCREISKTFHRAGDAHKKIQSAQLTRFLGQRGPRTGNISAVYYGAYVYFEKLRVKNGTAKSKKRLEVEGAHPNGMDRQTNYGSQGIIAPMDAHVWMDALGKFHVEGGSYRRAY